MKDNPRSHSHLSWGVPIGLGLLVAAASVVLWAPRRSAEPQEPLPDSQPAVSGSSDHAREPESVGARAAVELERTTEASALSEFERLWGPALEVATFEAPLEGTLRVWSRTGQELPACGGWIEFRVHRGPRVAHLRRHVHAGAWSIDSDDLEGFDLLKVAEIWAHGAPAEPLEEFALRELPNPRRIELRARQSEATTLRVLDSRTGVDLAGVRIALPRSFPYDDLPHPGMDISGRMLAEGERSPFAIPESFFDTRSRLSRGVYSISAPGYAWKLVRLNVHEGGERRVQLEQAGDLVVDLVGVTPDAHAELRLAPTDSHLLAAVEPLAEDGPIEIAELAPGTYRVRVEVGPWFSDPLILGEAQVQLAAGATTELRLELAAAPILETAGATGLVLVPEEWGRDSLHGSLWLVGTPLAGADRHQSLSMRGESSPRAGFHAFAWYHSKLQVGSHQLIVHEPFFTELIEVTGLDRSRFVTEVPPPVELSVLVVDALSGQAIETDELHWHPVLPEGVTGSSLETAESGGAPGQYRIRAPAAPIELSLWDWRYLPANEVVDLGRHPGPFTLSMTPACGFTLRLMDGETEIPLPESWGSSPVAIEGTLGMAGMHSGDKFGCRFQVTGPGTYALDLPTPDGYAPLPPLRIDVLAGEWRTIEVPLERRIP